MTIDERIARLKNAHLWERWPPEIEAREAELVDKTVENGQATDEDMRELRAIEEAFQLYCHGHNMRALEAEEKAFMALTIEEKLLRIYRELRQMNLLPGMRGLR